MKLPSWLSTCSSATSAATTTAGTAPKSPISDIQTPSSSSSSSSSNSSIQTNLSLLTLPSVPSLQILILSPETAATSSATTVLHTTLTPNRRAHINFLALHDNLLYAASGNEISVYETTNYTLFETFNVDKLSTGSVKSAAFRDGKIFTAHQDCKIRVWTLNHDTKQHKLIATLPTLEDRLRRFILPKNYVKIRRHKKKLWNEHYDVVSGLETCQSDTKMLVSISWDKSLKFWHGGKFQCMESINKAHDDAINAVVISNDDIIYTGSADKRIKAWRKEGNKYGLIATLEKHKSAVNALALGQNGSVLFSGSCDRSILVWEREDSAHHMAVAGALRGHAKAILCLINVRDLLLSGSGDRTVRIWRRGFGGRYCCLTVLDGHQTPVRSLAAAEGGGGGVKVFSGSFDGEIKVWQVDVGCVNGYD